MHQNIDTISYDYHSEWKLSEQTLNPDPSNEDPKSPNKSKILQSKPTQYILGLRRSISINNREYTQFTTTQKGQKRNQSINVQNNDLNNTYHLVLSRFDQIALPNCKFLAFWLLYDFRRVVLSPILFDI